MSFSRRDRRSIDRSEPGDEKRKHPVARVCARPRMKESNFYLQGCVGAKGYSRDGGNRGAGRPGGQW